MAGSRSHPSKLAAHQRCPRITVPVVLPVFSSATTRGVLRSGRHREQEISLILPSNLHAVRGRQKNWVRKAIINEKSNHLLQPRLGLSRDGASPRRRRSCWATATGLLDPGVFSIGTRNTFRKNYRSKNMIDQLLNSLDKRLGSSCTASRPCRCHCVVTLLLRLHKSGANRSLCPANRDSQTVFLTGRKGEVRDWIEWSQTRKRGRSRSFDPLLSERREKKSDQGYVRPSCTRTTRSRRLRQRQRRHDQLDIIG